MSEQENIDVIKDAYDRFANGNLPGMLDLFSTDIEWRTQEVENSFFPGALRGRNEVKRFFEKLIESADYSNFEPLEYIASGNKVVVIGTATATVKETRRDFTSEWIHVFTVEDSKVVKFQEFFDTAAVGQAFQKAASAHANDG